MKSSKTYIVQALWDEEAKVWVASSDQVPGLATEAESLDKLIPKLQMMIPELLDANGCEDGDEIHFDIRGEVNGIVAHRRAA